MIMLNTNFSPWPSFTEQEAEAIKHVLLSNKVNYWTGTEAREFEREFADYTGCSYAVALANGTVALDLALMAFDIGVGDEVIVTPRTFIASASSVVTAGATPVFADVDRTTQALSAETIAKVLTPKTKAIVVVHLAGIPAEMDDIMDLARKHNIKVIEDCAQAHGARYKGQPVGSIGDVAAWSFCQDKIMTTGGEGGMVTTNDELLWRKMWAFKDHGKSYERIYEDKSEKPPGYRWLHESFGTNWRMTEVQAVLGRIQLSRMPQWHKARSENTSRIFECCEKIDWLRVPKLADHSTNACYKAYVFVCPEKLPSAWNRDVILEKIAAQNVPVFSGSCSEVYLEKAFDNTGWRPQKRCEVARELGETSVMFLVHPTLQESEIELTCQAILNTDKAIRDS